jgi:hypothetical protein
VALDAIKKTARIRAIYPLFFASAFNLCMEGPLYLE